MAQGIGEILQQARRGRGQSLAQVAGEMHVREPYLAALEEERFSVFNSDAYVRAFLRGYSEYLRVDPDRMVELFHQEYQDGRRIADYGADEHAGAAADRQPEPATARAGYQRHDYPGDNHQEDSNDGGVDQDYRQGFAEQGYDEQRYDDQNYDDQDYEPYQDAGYGDPGHQDTGQGFAPAGNGYGASANGFGAERYDEPGFDQGDDYPGRRTFGAFSPAGHGEAPAAFPDYAEHDEPGAFSGAHADQHGQPLYADELFEDDAPRRPPRLVIVGALLAAALVGFFGFKLLASTLFTSSDEPQAQTPASPVDAEPDGGQDEPAPASEPEVAEPQPAPSSDAPAPDPQVYTGDPVAQVIPVAGDRLAVEAVADGGDTWLQVHVDGASRASFTGLMREGQSRSFKGQRSVRMTVGAASSTALTVNGKPQTIRRNEKNVAIVEFRPGG